ncbi:hypothetical protein [Streptomyces sp.]|nr:hypothetical protein [Streptomyces sp.]HZF90453.1 hypothetical protein [Streptomyces sp.]
MAPVATAPVAVTITNRPDVEDEIEFVEDLDALAGNEVMRGCGEDNPY